MRKTPEINIIDQLADAGVLPHIFQFCGGDVKSVRLVSKTFSKWMNYLLALQAKKKICTLAIDYLQLPFNEKEIYGILKNFSLPELSYIGSLLVIHSFYVFVGTTTHERNSYHEDEATIKISAKTFGEDLRNKFFRRSVKRLLKKIHPSFTIQHGGMNKCFYEHLQGEDLAEDVKKCPLIQFITPYQLDAPADWDAVFAVSTSRAELMLATRWLIKFAGDSSNSLSSRMSGADWQQDVTLKDAMLGDNASAIILLDSMLKVYKPDEIIAFVRLQETFLASGWNSIARFYPCRDKVKFYERMSLLTAEQVADFCKNFQELKRKSFFDQALLWSGRLANVLLDFYLQSPKTFPVVLKKMSKFLGLLRFPYAENIVKLFILAHENDDQRRQFIMDMHQFIYSFVINDPELVQRLLVGDKELMKLLSSMSLQELKTLSFVMPFGRFPEISIQGIVDGIKKISQDDQLSFLRWASRSFLQEPFIPVKPLLNFQSSSVLHMLNKSERGYKALRTLDIVNNFDVSPPNTTSLLFKYFSLDEVYEMFKTTGEGLSTDLMCPPVVRFFHQHLAWDDAKKTIPTNVESIKNFMQSRVVRVLFEKRIEVNLSDYFVLWQSNPEAIERRLDAIVSYNNRKENTIVIKLLRQPDVDQFIDYLNKLPEVIRKNIKDVCAAYQLYKQSPPARGHLHSQNLFEYVLLRHATNCWSDFISSMPAFDLDATDQEKQQFFDSVITHYQKEGIAATQFINTDGDYLRDIRLQLYHENSVGFFAELKRENLKIMRLLNRQEFRGLRAILIGQETQANLRGDYRVAYSLVFLLDLLYGDGQVNPHKIVNLKVLLSYFGIVEIGSVLEPKEDKSKAFIVKFINSVDSHEWLMKGYLVSEFGQLVTDYEAKFAAEVDSSESMQFQK